MVKKVGKVYNIVDLFSWCGWFSYGFQMANFHALLGVDNRQPSLDTFKLNHNNSDVLCWDLWEDSVVDEVINKVWETKVDVIIAWPPCQGFSLTGTRNENDKRNKLFYSVFKVAEKLKPQVIVIENVPWLATLYDGKAKDAIISEFERLWYDYKYKVLFAPDYGVPQIRKRIVFVWYRRGGGEFNFPEPSHNQKEYVTTKEAIWDLHDPKNNEWKDVDKYFTKPLSNYQKFMRQWANHLYNHVWTKHTDHVINVISQVPDWWNHKDLPKGVGDSRKFNEAWTRYNSNKPSKTIDTWHRNHFHYKYNRIPTVRENARLQSFPDVFKFTGTKTQQYKMVGNAVPPLLWYNLAKEIYKFLEKLN